MKRKPIYVKVTKIIPEWVEVKAKTLEEAKQKAMSLPGVGIVISTSYINPQVDTDHTANGVA